MPWTYGWAETSPPKFPIIKAHGSLNWNASGLHSGEWCCESKREVIQGVHYDAERPLADIFPDCINANFGMMLLPPGPTAKERPATNVLASQAAAILRRSAKVFVIGYSLPDYDAGSRELLTAVPQHAPIEIVDKSLGTLDKWRKVPGRDVKVTESAFEDCALAKPGATIC